MGGQKHTYHNKEAGIFMDSGAFSAYMKNTSVDLDKYIQFLHENKHLFEVYCSLDVIGDPKATWDNFKKMEDAGLQPLPVFHIGDPEECLHKCLEYDYFCLGGVASVGASSLRVPFLDRAFTIICDKDGMPRSKVHGLGMTSFELIRRYPFYSVDSTSWAMSAAMGGVWIPCKSDDGSYDFSKNPNLINFSSREESDKKKGKHFEAIGEDYKNYILCYLSGIGFDIDKIKENYIDRASANVSFLIEFQRCFKKWPWRFANFRKNIFF